MEDICSLGVAELAAAFRSGSVTPTDAVEACIAHIKKVDGSIGAWQEIYEDEARAEAIRATAHFKEKPDDDALHLMTGVPFALKDIIDVQGKVTTAGCAERTNHVATATATIAARLIASGGILIGKVKTVEFARGGWGRNQHMGTPRNPWTAGPYKHLCCGGSSSGSGAVVASHTVPCAVGTDTGGSVRLPASFCGTVGLKTTKGMLPTDGIVPLSHTFDTPGPLARSVADAAIMCAAMMDAGEGATFMDQAESAMKQGIAGLRLAVIGDTTRKLVTDAKQLEAFDRAVGVLRGLGAEITTYDYDTDAFKLNAISKYEGYYHHKEMAENPSSKMDDGIRAKMFQSKEVTLEEYVTWSLKRAPALEAFIEGMGDRIALLSPTTNVTAIEIDAIDDGPPPVGPSSFTSFVNFLGICAISVPTGPAIDGEEMALPTSLQITCLPNDEITALRIAKAYETSRGPLARAPLSF